jgi:hypothetical protein
MGYHTHFWGSVSITPPLSQDEIVFLKAFSRTRHVIRDAGPYYIEYVKVGAKSCGRKNGNECENLPDDGQPGVWCAWIPSDDGAEILWNGQEKAGYAAEWMQYIIDHFLQPIPLAQQAQPTRFRFLAGHKLDGEFGAQGDESSDRWKLVVRSNQVAVVPIEVIEVELAPRQIVRTCEPPLLGPHAGEFPVLPSAG